MMMKLQYLLAVCAGLLGGATLCVAERYEVTTSAPADGEIFDRSQPWDHVPDELDNLGKVAKVGSWYGKEYVSLFEFPLPPKKADLGHLKSAKLVLCSHSKGVSPVTIELYAYAGETADGLVALNDWSAGQSLGLYMVEGETEISMLNRVPPFDVTEAVRQVIESESRFIGFRLRCPESVQSKGASGNKGIVFRVSEFAEKFPNYAPQLILDYN